MFKIENLQGLKNINKIIRLSDGIMIARGDLGVEIPSERLPMVQKDLLVKCNVKGKVAIVATEMLKSMVSNWRPTRAETSDVANAVLDGADFVMLSEETAVGSYPVEAVRKMARILKVSDELLQDALFNVQGFVANQFARSFGLLEEEAFVIGDGSGKPTGITVDATDSGFTVTQSGIVADDFIDTFHALPPQYRSRAT